MSWCRFSEWSEKPRLSRSWNMKIEQGSWSGDLPAEVPYPPNSACQRHTASITSRHHPTTTQNPPQVRRYFVEADQGATGIVLGMVGEFVVVERDAIGADLDAGGGLGRPRVDEEPGGHGLSVAEGRLPPAQ